MPSYGAPGAYVDEVINPSSAITGPSISLGAFMAPNARGPVVPTLITSWPQYLALFGGFASPTQYLPWAVHGFFTNGGRQCYVMRVPGTGAALATRILNDRAGTPLPTLTVNALNVGAWGNSVFVDIIDSGLTRFNLVVHYGGTGDAFIVERWLDLSMDPIDPRYVEAIINNPVSGSRYISVTNALSATAAPTNRPAAQNGTALAAGADGAVPTALQNQTALANLDVITEPFLLAMPGESTAATINAAIAYCAARLDAFFIADTASGLTAAAAITAATAYTQSSYAATYWPWVWFSDPSNSTPGAMKLLPPSGAVMGQYANTDALRGVWKAPAGSTNRLAGSMALETKLTQQNLKDLHAAQVNAIRQLPGFGIVVYGGRTLKPGAVDKYVSARRSLIYIESALVAGTQWAVFEPNDATLWSSLETQVERFLLGFWQAGGLAGASAREAFYVKCDADTNPPGGIDGGAVTIEVGVALQRPAEFVVIRIGQWDGGSYANENPQPLAA